MQGPPSLILERVRSKFWFAIDFEFNAFLTFSNSCKHKEQIKVVVRVCHGAYFVAHVFKYLALPKDLRDAAR